MFKLMATLVSWILSSFLWVGEGLERWRGLGGLARGGSLGLAVIGIAFLGYGGSQVFSYSQNDPNFCRSCHTMEVAWQRWNTSEHAGINCHNCHEQSPIESMNLVVEYALNNPDRVVKHAGISDEACLKCHGDGKLPSPQILNTAGHQVHFETQAISCVKCHSVSIHRFAPSTAICQVCHPNEHIKITAMGETHCLDCHQFLKQSTSLTTIRQASLFPSRVACLACHMSQPQTKVTWPADAPMQFDCGQCHKPHLSATPVVDCISCHKGVREQGLHAKTSHLQTTCQTCHKPHEWKVQSRDNCLACHGNKAAHNAPTLCTTCHDFHKTAPNPGST